MRLAVANLHRPGAPTGAIMLSLGLGLSLIAAIALIDRNLRMAINEQLPERAPSLIFIDVPSGDVAAFDALVKGFKSAASYERYPMLRGRIVKLKGVPAAQAQVDPSVRWALNGDRGISYGDPAGAKAQVVAGTWWAPGDVGQRKVSFDENLAQGMGLTVGDTVTVNVLGRDLELTIASLRRVDYANARLNFSLIVAPGLLEGAPHMHLASVRVAPDEERAVEQSVSARYPSISIVRVREAIETANGLLAQLADALRAASLITLVTGFLVLWGSIAAGQRQRLYDAVVMKVLGASRARILWVSILEFALIGLAAAVVACLAGGLAAWAVITFVMQGTFILSPDVLALVVLTGLTATLGLGLMATWSTLSVKPARQLRTL
ncbi:MAG TPA: hypothetical protein DCL54_07805 [Alphaproteobacteria bacterium]|nr:hypothetical protein [Alphaproteobacteria bacterium]